MIRAILDKPRTRSVKEIKAELDLQKQMEEAALERSNIAKALLAIQHSLDQIAPAVSKMEPVLASLEPIVNDLSAWRPGVDTAIGQLRADLSDMRAQLEKIALGSAGVGKAGDPPSSATADAPVLDSGLAGDGHGKISHCETSQTRASPFVGSLLPTPVPANGMFRPPFPTVPRSNPLESGGHHSIGRGTAPTVDCPEFDGDNPTGWRMKCEAYFRIWAIDPGIWVDTAVVKFTGAAALWLEWSHVHIKYNSWDLFVASVLDKFGRSEFQQLLRKFSRLKQTGSVLEYAEQFNVAMHSLLAHHGSWDPLFFTTHFLDGLRHEIKVAVMFHRP